MVVGALILLILLDRKQTGASRGLAGCLLGAGDIGRRRCGSRVFCLSEALNRLGISA